jgi:hypothetical protein
MNKQLETVCWIIAGFCLMLGLLWVTTRPSEAEYHHCLVTTFAPHKLCNSIKP